MPSSNLRSPSQYSPLLFQEPRLNLNTTSHSYSYPHPFPVSPPFSLELQLRNLQSPARHGGGRLESWTWGWRLYPWKAVYDIWDLLRYGDLKRRKVLNAVAGVMARSKYQLPFPVLFFFFLLARFTPGVCGRRINDEYSLSSSKPACHHHTDPVEPAC